MNDTPRSSGGRPRKWIILGILLAVILPLGLGIEAYILLRSWKRGTLVQTGSAAESNVVSVADQNSTEIAPVNPPENPDPQPRLRNAVLNDHFVNRFTLDTPAHVTALSARATNERGERIQNTQVGLVRWGDTLWWRWVAPTSGPVIVDTLGSDYDTYLAVYTGTAVNALTVVAENDNESEVGVGASRVSFEAREGTEYEIQVGGVFTGGGRGSIPVKGALELNLFMPPSVTIDPSVAGAVFPLGSNFAVNISASSISRAITNVSLYRGATLLGNATVTPFKITVSNAPAATNSLFAVATDEMGQIGTSAVVQVLVANPGLTITFPAEGSVFLNNKPITVSAFGVLRGGAFTNVSFLVDGQPVGESTSTPFNATWNSVLSGSHRLTARALDNTGNAHEAPPVSFAVAQMFFPTGSVWKYLDDGSDQVAAWISPGFNDNAWKSGPGELGYGDKDEATRLEDNGTAGFNARDREHYITAYFRRAFVVTNAASYAHLLMNVKRDDGAVVYLNGREAARFNMNSGTVNFTTLARNAGDDGKAFVRAQVPASFLVEGTNVVAVEIHQASVDSTDISFEMDLSGIPAPSRTR
jgi:hypothetical protein